jgi:hypothetical protein
MISGTTSHKLDKAKTYSKNEPYKVGVNGVTSIDVDENGEPINVFYNVDGIDYETNLSTINRFIDNNKPLVNLNNGTKVNAETNFKTNLPSYSNFLTNDTVFLKEEVKIGLVFPTKTDNQIFIERQSGTVLEQHNRLSEITNLDELISYRNGYYNIKNDF